MAKKDKTSTLEPDKEDLKILQQEVGDGGYFGWFGTRKHAETKAMLKAELWQTQKDKAEMKYKICIIHNIENTTAFKESYFAGALYADNGALLAGLVNKFKDINISSALSLLNVFTHQSQT